MNGLVLLLLIASVLASVRERTTTGGGKETAVRHRRPFQADKDAGCFSKSSSMNNSSASETNVARIDDADVVEDVVEDDIADENGQEEIEDVESNSSEDENDEANQDENQASSTTSSSGSERGRAGPSGSSSTSTSSSFSTEYKPIVQHQSQASLKDAVTRLLLTQLTTGPAASHYLAQAQRALPLDPNSSLSSLQTAVAFIAVGLVIEANIMNKFQFVPKRDQMAFWIAKAAFLLFAPMILRNADIFRQKYLDKCFVYS